MSLPWVRLDSNIASHDKIVTLLAEKEGQKAFVLYICGLGYAGGHATDGLIPRASLPFIHGTERLAVMLVNQRLWEHTEGGWKIRNWDQRQELTIVAEMKRAGRKAAGLKGACKKWHGPQCECWKAGVDEW